MKRMRKQNKMMFLLLVLLGISVGYALISTTLKITGIAGLKGNTWDIHWENVKVTNGSAEATTPANITNSTTVEFNVTLNEPGEFYEFTVDAVNNGTVNGEISAVNFDVYDQTGTTKLDPEEIPSYISKTIKLNGSDIQSPHILNAGRSEKYKIRVEYTEDIEEKDLEKDFNCVFKVGVTYRQTKSQSSSSGTITFIRNTDPNVKGLIGTAYLNPTDYTVTCDPSSPTERMPMFVATSNYDHDMYARESYPGNYYSSATSWASSNNGCMKFYAYKDTGDSYKLILDHNTTVMTSIHTYGGSTGGYYYDIDESDPDSATKYCPEVYSDERDIIRCEFILGHMLRRDTKGWESTATLISYDEIYEMVARYTPERIGNVIDLNNGYDWLLDNMESVDNSNCDEPSCYVKGYWTKEVGWSCEDGEDGCTFGETIAISNVDLNGTIEPNTVAGFEPYIYDPDYIKKDHWLGVRPVIVVPKSYFKD